MRAAAGFDAGGGPRTDSPIQMFGWCWQAGRCREGTSKARGQRGCYPAAFNDGPSLCLLRWPPPCGLSAQSLPLAGRRMMTDRQSLSIIIDQSISSNSPSLEAKGSGV